MNTLLHLGDIALQYYRGRKTGLVGLAAIFITIIIVAAWDYISPIFRLTGISSALTNIGLVTPGDAALSGYKILFAIVAVYFLLILITFPALVFFAILHRLVSSKLGTYGMTAMLGVLLSPLIILNFFLKLFIPNIKKTELAPTTIVDELLTYKCAEGEDNAITFEEAKSYLNRLPTISDNFFLLGVTHEEDLYALLPRPFDVSIYGDVHNKLFCKRLNVHRYNHVNDKIPSYARVPDAFVAEIEVNSRINDIDVEKFASNRFKDFVKASNIPDLMNAFSIYMENEQYKSYVKVVQNNFYKGMDKIKYELGNGLDQQSFNTLKEELKHYEKVPNQSIIRFVWEG
ncbi:hypothetical protein [Terribacillus sp. DMT04]|uniref:hypothetical protein n=1 Tax=Terribacillus sp. DMT04 TaxID=2850441 RepID=UPI001C2BA8B7|nr:hypothetical protein [Terribacillus sp. DMT04]QXE03601.1 hypothetical protein KS242_17610 [Terribacillus sp. DMT04]